MTLVLAASGSESLWLLTDRRLTAGNRVVSDNAQKTVWLKATDGVGLLGYAGLGRTKLGTEPEDWITAVLRNRKLTVDKALSAVAGAMQRRLPPHLSGLQSPQHFLVAPAYIAGQATLYAIELVCGSKPFFRFSRHLARWPSGVQTVPRFGVSGTGGLYLVNQGKSWARSLLRVLDAHDRKAVSTALVAKHFADTNAMVHRGLSRMRDNSVGPSCTVTWLFRPGGSHGGGGGYQFFTDGVPDASSPPLLTADANMGFNLSALDQAVLKVVVPEMRQYAQSLLRGELRDFQPNVHKLNEEHDRISPPADEKLR